MADSINKANKRQAGRASKKAHYATNFERGKKNKLRRMNSTLRRQPENEQLARRISWWKEHGHERKGTKRA